MIDAGYNISSDASLTRSASVTTSKFNVNPGLESQLSPIGVKIGGTYGTNTMITLTILSNSPANSFVPGVPGVTFPATDETLADRRTPTSGGAYEFNPITVQSNAGLPTILSISPGTNLTGAGKSVTFTATVNSQIHTNPLPFGYQWQFNGTNVSDGASYSGTASNVLTIKNAGLADEGQYVVVVSPTLLEGRRHQHAAGGVDPDQSAGHRQRVERSLAAFGIDRDLYFGRWPLSARLLLSMAAQWKQPAPEPYSGANSNVLTIDPATATNAGLYSVIVSNGFDGNDYGTKTSAVVRLTITPDNTRPTVTIVSPLLNARTNNPNMLIAYGVAPDNAQVSNVMYWFTNYNAGLNPPVTTNVYGLATLTTNGNTNVNIAQTLFWSITNPPAPGTNILAVQSVDYSGNRSPVVTRRFFYQVPANLNLTTEHYRRSGDADRPCFHQRRHAPSNSATLNIGEGYSIVATPNSTSLLGNWTNTLGTNLVVTNGNTINFIMESGTDIQAFFVSNIFLGAEFTGLTTAFSM